MSALSARIQAFFIHLAGSLILGAAVLALVFLVWYPAPLAQVQGVTHIFLMMLCIDVIIGPLLTLLVYKKGKKTLKFDLTTIIFLQLCMFGYGLHTVAAGRPAWLVFSVDQFYLVRTADISTKLSLQDIPWLGPQWVTVHLPSDRQQRKDIISKTLQAGNAPFMTPSLYAPLQESRVHIQQQAHPLSELGNYNTSIKLKTTLSQWPTAQSWLPLWNSSQSMTVLLDKNGQVVAISDLNPWKQ